MASLFLLLSLPKVSRATNFPALGTAERCRGREGTFMQRGTCPAHEFIK